MDINEIASRRRGRSRIIRTGRPGRPQKEYLANLSEVAWTAEVSVKYAINGEDSREW